MKSTTFKLFTAMCGIGFTLWMVSCSPSKTESNTTEETTPPATTEQPAATAGAGNAEAGKAIVTDPVKCAMCHKLTDEKLIGPGLKGVTDKRTEDWIKNMVKDPTKWVETDPDAKKLFEEYGKVPMTPLSLTDEQINDVYAFLKQNDGK